MFADWLIFTPKCHQGCSNYMHSEQVYFFVFVLGGSDQSQAWGDWSESYQKLKVNIYVEFAFIQK